MKICNENLVGDEYYLLIPCSAYKVIHEKYDDLLDGHDNAIVLLKCLPRSVNTYVHVLFSQVITAEQ